MKKIFSILIIIAICLSLTSCDFNITSIESLMRPPKLSGESSLLQKAFEESVADRDGVIMKTPINGENRSSYLFYDIEKDGTQEAIVFFSEPLKDVYACASIFKFVNNEWKYVSQIKGKGEEIYEVNFADINGDGVSEILLSWSGIGAQEKINVSDFGAGNNRFLAIYSYDGITTTLLKTETYTNLYLEDLNDDRFDEIILFKINLNDNEKRTTAMILGFNDDYTVKFDQLLTLTGFLEIGNIVTDSVEQNNKKHTRIYVDGAVSEIGVITEIIDIEHETFEIVLPLYAQNQSVQPPTLRDSRVYSQDMDNDGIVEIPTIEVLPNGARILEETSERKDLNLTVWSEFTNNEIIVDFKCLLNSTYGYYFIFPDDVKNKITAIYDDNNLTLTFYTINETGTYNSDLFSVKIFFEPDWEENNYKYIKFNENNMYVYGYMILDDTDGMEYVDFINENFKIIN